MNSIMRWDPIRELEDFQNRLSNIFSSPSNKTLVRKEAKPDEWFGLSEWSPAVDISEDEREYLIKAEIPEVKREDVKVKVEDGVLAISGERKFEKDEKDGKKFHRVERAFGSFMRSFSLPEDTDSSKVSAEFKDGLLKVHLPKSESAKPKLIDVKVM